MSISQRIREKTRGSRFLSGVSVLTLSAVLVKIIGLSYRIPMLNKLGSEGMGYFNTAYEVYALLCVIATAGLPVAMSVLIAEVESRQRQDAVVRRIFRVSMGVFLGIGLLGSALMWGLSAPLSRLLGNPGAAACMKAISPTVLLICLSSAFRGCFQGRRNMLPTATSQIIEAMGKLFLGLLFAGYARSRGADLPTMAAFAVLGLTVGTALSVVYLALHKRLSDRRGAGKATAATEEVSLLSREAVEIPSHRQILRRLLLTAVPVTVSAGVISLTKCVDLALILRRMQDMGLSAKEANILYGCYSTLAVPVFNILPSLTTSVSMSVVPALSSALARLRAATDPALQESAREDLRKTSVSALTLTLVLSVPAGIGLCVFAGDILRLLFAGQPEAVAMATPWLRVLGLSVPAACLITVSGAMLQAAGHAGCPVISMLVGTGVKAFLSYLLLGCPSLGLLGAPISSLVCDTLILGVNLVFLARYAPDMLPRMRTGLGLVLCPLGISVLSFVPVLYVSGRRGAVGDSPLGTLCRLAAVGGIYVLGFLAVWWRRRALKK